MSVADLGLLVCPSKFLVSDVKLTAPRANKQDLFEAKHGLFYGFCLWHSGWVLVGFCWGKGMELSQ